VKPLAGCRVLDMGIITAGAATSALLADLGAEVIKVEAPRYRDPFRQWAADSPADDPTALPPFFKATNRNKTSISVDLKTAEGNALFCKLVAKSDVVVENFRRGVLKGLDLEYAKLRSFNPSIILASISSQGETGPDARQVSFGTTLEAVAGLSWLTGYAGDRPVVSGVDLNYPDQVVAIFAAGMIITAWYAKQNGHGGVHLDMAQRELTSFLCGEAFATPAAFAARAGNARAPYAIQDCFRAADGLWIALSVTRDELPKLAPFGAELAAWIAGRNAAEAREALAQAGIAAAIVLGASEVLDAWRAAPSFALTETPDGSLAKGFPFQIDGEPLSVTRDAPILGADTRAILTEIGGFSAAEIDDFIARGIVEIDAAAAAASS
jgi:crotonobetainyl-CoA:carnitine CoA-transferase CaiB-like acyl-CoA transferase